MTHPSNNDFGVSAVSTPQHNTNAVNKRPPHLVILSVRQGSKTEEKFISLDKPNYYDGFVSAKGFYATNTEGEIIESFNKLIDAKPKEEILEMMFPIHRVIHIRSLVFKKQ